MAAPRVPTWTELRLDAAKLLRAQELCYRNTQNLLEVTLPQLSRKISRLKHGDTSSLEESTQTNPPGHNQPPHELTPQRTPERESRGYCTYAHETPGPALCTQILELSPVPSPQKERPPKKQQPLGPAGDPPPTTQLVRQSHPPETTKGTFTGQQQQQSPTRDRLTLSRAPDSPTASDFTLCHTLPMEIDKSPMLIVKPPTRSPSQASVHRPSTPPQPIEKPKLVKSPITVSRPTIYNRPRNLTITRPKEQPRIVDVTDYEHLKPLPLPLSEYWRANRPVLAQKAFKRSQYLSKKSAIRRYRASTRVINSLAHLRISNVARSKSSNGGGGFFSNINNGNKIRSTNRQANETNRLAPSNGKHEFHPIGGACYAPDYCVKYKMTERDMRRQTAKIYKRLPEVKKRNMEEDASYLKAQYYKNKKDYAQRLLQNRRQGIINYPLRSYDDTSLSSSREDVMSL